MRKDLKKEARFVLKKHYIFLVLVCLIASILGSDFGNSLASYKNTDSGFINELGQEVMIIRKDGFDGLKEVATKKQEKVINNNRSNVLDRKAGVLAFLVNSISTGSLLAMIGSAIYVYVGSTNVAAGIFIFGALLVYFAFWFLFSNIYKVIMRRIMLEARTYKVVPKERFLFLYKVKKWFKTAVTLFVTWIYQFLWNLTIVGGIIKHYSYFMVPFILAENPDAKTRDVITLSRNMMNGHKMECFKLELSFILWDILGLCTLGLSKILFSNPYQMLTYSGYYEKVRNEAINNEVLNYNIFNDKYLFKKADSLKLKKTYYDVIEAMIKENKDKKYLDKITGFKKVLLEVFGINVCSLKVSKKYDDYNMNLLKVNDYKSQMKGESYPARLYNIPLKSRRLHISSLNYLRPYRLSSLVIIFMSMCFIGWAWEVVLHLIMDGKFVNRGTLYGPWLPIYGMGGLVILVLLNKFREKPFLEFSLMVVIC